MTGERLVELMFFQKRNVAMPTQDTALKGRAAPMPLANKHTVLGTPLAPPYPAGFETAVFALGCFWGAERLFWKLGSGIYSTAVGYAGGLTPNPTYEEVSSGKTGHTEVVLVVYDPKTITYQDLLRTFWESHDPTQGFRQGNDVGTQYRSAIYTHGPAQLAAATASRSDYQAAISARGFDPITTEIAAAGPFYFAEEYHQQYLAKNPGGYCNIGGTGVACALPPAKVSV